MTVTELIAKVFQRLEETQSNPAFWDEDDIRDSLADAWEDLALAVRWYRTSVMIPLQDETTYYDLRDWSVDEFITVERIHNETLDRYLEPVAVRDLNLRYNRWEVSQNAQHEWFMRGNFALGVFGLPSIGDNSDFITVEGRAIPQSLPADDATLPLPDEWCELIIDYILYDLKVQEGEVELGLELWQRYLLGAEAMQGWTFDQVNHGAYRVLGER